MDDANGSVAMLTIPAVAHELGVSRQTAHNLTRRGELPVLQLGTGQGRGKLLRVRRLDLAEFVERAERRANEDDR
jgi:predicted site-specific integrase-resolvase